MDKKIFVIEISFKKIIILIAIVICCLSSNYVYCDDSKPYKIKTIVIDPGHGGRDPGTVGKKNYEKDIALNIALLLGSYIETYVPEVKVIYTRKTDTSVELHKRAEIANRNKADLFISIHVNSNRDKDIVGASTYVMGPHKTDDNLEVAKLENSVIVSEDDYTTKYEGYDPSSPESYIIFSLLQHTYLEQSMLLANMVQQQFEERAKRTNLGVKQAGFLVLWNSTMPSILVESGFITNEAEEEYLGSKYGQEIIASAIFRGFREYKKMVEKQTSLYASDENIDLQNKKSFKNPEPIQNQKDSRKPETDIVLKLQIKSSYKKIPLQPDNFNGLKGVEEYTENNIFKYTFGSVGSLEEIIALQERIRKLFPDAFAVAFKGNKKIPYNEAVKELNIK